MATVCATTAYASSSSNANCFDRGIIDWEEYPFIQKTHSRCEGDYYEGFTEGYVSVDDGDTVGDYERSTDA
jgi:hypothetical protein